MKLAHLPLWALLCLSTALIAGCSSNFDTTVGPPVSLSMGTISGTAYGGRFPIANAKVYLLEANTTHDAGPGTSGTSNTSKSLLSSGDGSDSVGFYVLTNASGGFTLTGKYNACDSGEQVYVYSLGGKPDGTDANSAAGLMAVLGNCGTFAFTSGTTINMNEVSTIAAAYAMAGYATDATHVGYSGTALARVGIRNAFANANQMFDITQSPSIPAHNLARTSTPNGNGTVPQKQIHTLANIIASCVDSAGPGVSNCSNLFNNLKSGGTTGTTATDTATLAIYMAQNPTTNVSTLYGVTGSGPNPYTPWYNTSAPTDFIIALTFTGGGLNQPYDLAVDASGYIWVANSGNNTVGEFEPSGKADSGSGFTGGGVINGDYYLGVDATGDIWVPNYNSNTVTKLLPSGSVAPGGSGYTAPALVNPTAIAFDKSGDAWVTEGGTLGAQDNGTLAELSSTGGNLSGTTGFQGSGISNDQETYGIAIDAVNSHVWATDPQATSVSILNVSNGASSYSAPTNGYLVVSSAGEYPWGVAMDNSGNAWVISNGPDLLSEMSATGSILNTYGSRGGLMNAYNIMFDGAGRIWIANNGVQDPSTNLPTNVSSSVTELSSTGTAISPSTGYTDGGIAGPYSTVIDGSGNVWTGNWYTNTLTEFVGAAAPVVTPLCATLSAPYSKNYSRP